MENIKHINFINDRAIIYYGYKKNKQLEVSRKAGEYAVREYAKVHDIRNYNELINSDFINVYKLNEKNRTIKEVAPDSIVRKLKLLERVEQYKHTSFEAILFTEENNELYIDIVYKYFVRIDDELKEKFLKERVTLNEGIDLLQDYAEYNDITDPRKLFARIGNVRVKNEITSTFQKVILPKLNKAICKEKPKNINNKKAKEIKKAEIKDIRKVILYPSVDKDNKNVMKAFIFYKTGAIENVSKEDADDMIEKFAKEYDVSKSGLLYNEYIGFFEMKSAKDVVENFQRYREEAIKDNKYLTNYLNHIYSDYLENKIKLQKEVQEEQKEEKEEKKAQEEKKENKKTKVFSNLFTSIKIKLQKSRLVKKIAIFGSTLGVLFGGYATLKLLHNSATGTVKESSTVLASDNSSILDNHIPKTKSYEDFSVYNYNELLNKCRNNLSRKCTVKKFYDFINDYNGRIADSYKEENTNTKIAHTMDETTSMYLTYNNLSNNDINKIFETADLSFKNLKDNLISAQYQDTLAHNIQTRTLGKWKLLEKQEDRDLYNKYENIFIEMNKSNDILVKASYKEQFNNMVREDLVDMANNDYKNVDSSKILIKEFMDAMDNVNVEVSNPLTSEEKNYINGIMENVVDKKLKNIAIKQTARNIEKFIEINVIPDNEPYFNDFSKAIIRELEKQNSYYTNDENRDVSTYNKFASNTVLNIDIKSNSQEQMADHIIEQMEKGSSEYMANKVFVK